MHLDTAFTELRSVLNHAHWNEGDRAKIWALIEQASRWDEAAYMDQWMPYLSAFAHHWQQPLKHLKTQHALLHATTLCPFARFGFTMQTKHLVYSATWFEQVDWSMIEVDIKLRKYSLNMATVKHIKSLPKLPHVRRFHANGQDLTTTMAQMLLMWVDGPHLTSLKMANNLIDDDILDTLHVMKARHSLVDIDLRNRSLSYRFARQFKQDEWPELKHLLI